MKLKYKNGNDLTSYFWNFYNKKRLNYKITLKNWFKNTKGSWKFLKIIEINLENAKKEIEEINKNFDLNFDLNFVSKNKNNEISSIYFIDKKIKWIIRISDHWSKTVNYNNEDFEDFEDLEDLEDLENLNLNCKNIKSCFWNLKIDSEFEFKKNLENLKFNFEKKAIIAIIDMKDLKSSL